MSDAPDNPDSELAAARALGQDIANKVGLAVTTEEADSLVDQLSRIRTIFESDEDLTQSHVFALVNSSAQALSDEVFARNELVVQQIRSIQRTISWEDCNPSGSDMDVIAYQYRGLLERGLTTRAHEQLARMTDRGMSGTSSERLSWLVALRTGFYIALDKQNVVAMDTALDWVRAFRERNPERLPIPFSPCS